MRFEKFTFRSILTAARMTLTRWSIAARFATQEEAVQAIPGSVRPHAAVHRRRRPMEVPAARHRYRRLRKASSHARGKA